MKKIILIIGFVLINSTFIFAQKEWNGSASNEWSNDNNWSPSGVPTYGESVTIPSEKGGNDEWPTLDASGECGSLTNNGTLNISANTLTVNGNFINNGTCSPTGGFLDIKGDFTNSGAFLAPGGYMKFSGGTDQHIYGASSFSGLQFRNSMAVVYLQDNQTMSGYLWMYPNSTLDLGIYSLDGANNIQLISNAILKIGGTGHFPTCSGNVILQPNTTIEYYGTTQTVSTFTAFSGLSEYGQLIISGSGIKTLQGNIYPVSLTINAGTLDLGSYAADRRSSYYSGELTIANGATLKIGGTGDFPVYSTHNIGSSSTVEFSGSNQTCGYASYGNLTLSESGTKTGGSLTVNGWLAIYDVILSGTFNVTSGNYHFAGSGAQIISPKKIGRAHV